jgi:hypothetical protein
MLTHDEILARFKDLARSYRLEVRDVVAIVQRTNEILHECQLNEYDFRELEFEEWLVEEPDLTFEERLGMLRRIDAMLSSLVMIEPCPLRQAEMQRAIDEQTAQYPKARRFLEKKAN